MQQTCNQKRWAKRRKEQALVVGFLGELGADSTASTQALLSDSEAHSPLSFVYRCHSSARRVWDISPYNRYLSVKNLLKLFLTLNLILNSYYHHLRLSVCHFRKP